MDVADETRSTLALDPTRLERAHLVAVWEGGFATCPVPEQGRLVLGRGASCTLRLGAVAVSREHAAVYAGTPPVIEDLGSSNGTWLDGVKLAPGQRAPLTPGRSLRLGDALVVLQGATLAKDPSAVAPTAPSPPNESGIERLGRLVDLVASSMLPVILHGETGAGKEVTAERIHRQSARARAPYLKINCAAFAEAMVESELFGHERGAFTGATHAKAGLFEAARGGTVLLDEVTELSAPIQAKLLRALGNGEVLRVGATKPTAIDVRFIAATNQDFASLVTTGRFRADLYFRLNGITLEIPPLRERRSEILGLAETFSLNAAAALGQAGPGFTRAAQDWLLAYSWPGNVRELKNLVERATLLAQRGPIDCSHLQADALSLAAARPSAAEAPSADAVPLTAAVPAAQPQRPTSGAAGELRQELRDIERERIVAAMSQAGGNQTLAARLLGISRRALITRLENFQLPRPRKRQDGG